MRAMPTGAGYRILLEMFCTSDTHDNPAMWRVTRRRHVRLFLCDHRRTAINNERLSGVRKKKHCGRKRILRTCLLPSLRRVQTSRNRLQSKIQSKRRRAGTDHKKHKGRTQGAQRFHKVCFVLLVFCLCAFCGLFPSFLFNQSFRFDRHC